MKNGFLFFALFFSTLLSAGDSTATHLLRTGDTLRLRIYGNVVAYEAVPGEYENLRQGTLSLVPVTYRAAQKPFYTDDLSFHAAFPGTYYFAWSTGSVPVSLPDTIRSVKPPHLFFKQNCVQIVVRERDDYVGYLTELLHTPFILPPMQVPHAGHQADIRAGADCAELAIYGKRREGFKVPYCGPMGIKKYLDTLSGPPERGTVIHFGGQVSVLYEDRGVKGEIDDEDLLIESYGTGTQIVAFRDCAYHGRKFGLYSWKKKLSRL
ncbi:MAG: hypothetical protein FD123_355 [Bacteroidetes bacterium]|nr:MAG: hypothetical protein FD123_355 [Bacteroidota bacterium]